MNRRTSWSLISSSTLSLSSGSVIPANDTHRDQRPFFLFSHLPETAARFRFLRFLHFLAPFGWVAGGCVAGGACSGKRGEGVPAAARDGARRSAAGGRGAEA